MNLIIYYSFFTKALVVFLLKSYCLNHFVIIKKSDNVKSHQCQDVISLHSDLLKFCVKWGKRLTYFGVYIDSA